MFRKLFVLCIIVLFIGSSIATSVGKKPDRIDLDEPANEISDDNSISNTEIIKNNKIYGNDGKAYTEGYFNPGESSPGGRNVGRTIYLAPGLHGHEENSEYFLHISDIHWGGGGDANWYNFVNGDPPFDHWNINDMPKFVICTGDIVEYGSGTGGFLLYEELRQSGTLVGNEFNGWVVKLRTVQMIDVWIPILFSPGNHDFRYSSQLWPPGDTMGYRTQINWDLYYMDDQVDQPTIRIFSLNSGFDENILPPWIGSGWLPEGDGLYSWQLDQLEADLDALDGEQNGWDDSNLIKVIMFHHPLFNVFGQGGELLDGAFLYNRDRFINILSNYGIDLVSWGHTHGIISGSVAGSQFSDAGSLRDTGMYNKVYYKSKTTPPKPKSLYVISDTTFNICDDDYSYIQRYNIYGDETLWLDDEVSTSVPYGDGANNLAIDTDTNNLFVTFRGEECLGEKYLDKIKIFDAITFEELGEIAPSNTFWIWGIEKDQSSDLLYITNWSTIESKSNISIYKYDAVNYRLTLINTVTLPNCIEAYDIALDEINDLLFVADYGNDLGTSRVRYYNTTTWNEEGNFQVIHRPVFIEVDVSPHDPSHQIIYTTNGAYSFDLSKYDLGTGTETIVNMGHGGGDIVVDPATKLIYVCSYDNNRLDNISVWDPDLNLLYRTPPIEHFLAKTSKGMCIEGKQKYIWVDDDNTEGPWWNGTLKYPYQNISDGINTAEDDYTVFVFNGFYDENIVIDKSISLLGENKERTIINGSGADTVVTISADEVEFNGFTILNSGSSHAGISVYSDNNTIFENKIIFNNHGIFLDGASNNTISENIIMNNGEDGVIVKSQSLNNNLSNNTISFNTGNGINLSDSVWENIVYENTIEENGDSGIKLYASSVENVIIENTIIGNNNHGVYIPNIGSRNSRENIIGENSLKNNNYYNIYIATTDSDNNVLFHNNFIDNNNGGVQAYDECDNIWNDTLPSGGNYWSDYYGTDPDGNGIGNTPYDILGSSNQDQHPFIIQNGWKALYVDYDKPSGWYDARHVRTIQEGITNATTGDTVYVYQGTYIEQVIIEKSLTILGQDRVNTVIKGEVNGNVITITAPEVTFNNFTITHNYPSTTQTHGIDINSDHNTITGNIIRNNDDAIYIHDDAEFNNINRNIITGNNRGIYIECSSNSIIDSNIITDSSPSNWCYGILIKDSSNVNIYNNTINNHKWGIGLDNSDNNILNKNNITDIQEFCILIDNSIGNIFKENNITVSGDYGFYFAHDNPNNLNNDIDTSNTVNGNKILVLSNVRYDKIVEGIDVELTPFTRATNFGIINLYKCSNVTIRNSTIANHSYDGIFFYDSYDNTVDNITVRNSRSGIWVEGFSNNNKIENNNYSDNNSWNGIHLGLNSNNNTIANNTCSANWQEGIFLDASRDNKLLNNTCTLNRIVGIGLHSSNNNLLLENNCNSNMEYGIYLGGSDNNVLKNNECSYNDLSGIGLSLSCDNIIENNIVSWNENDYGNDGIGIKFYGGSNNNEIFRNTINNNIQYGVQISSGNDNNRMYHNNFINNNDGGVQAYDTGTDNIWNDLYFFGGNYWDDFNGGSWGINDDYTGENQDQQVPPGQPTPDGIIDNGSAAGGGRNPYDIFNGNNQDLYPLMYPWNGIPLFDAVINIDTCESFPTIQTAINDSDTLNGHTIYVPHGIYYENVIVGKSINLIGEDKDTTIIDGSQTGNVIRFDADQVNISGFTIKNSSQYGYGIYYFPNYPYTDYAENVTISGNIIEDCRISIGITRGYNINISSNIIRDCHYSGAGISLSDSVNTAIFENELINTGVWGLSLAYDVNNTVILRNTLKDISSGIFIGFSSNCAISENTITGTTTHGIRMWDSSNNIISENYIHDNLGDGIQLFTTSNNNQIYHNNFINNSDGNAYDVCNNAWDNGYPSGGNYWDDWSEGPYLIPPGNNVDNYPLQSPWV